MNAMRRRSVAAFLAMGAAAALAHVATPRTKLADLGPPIDLEAIFPSVFGAWRVDTNLPVILPAPDVQAKLDAIYNQVLSRTYVDNQGRRVMLSVAYGGDQSDGMNIHLPEVCYPAQGFQLVSRLRQTLSMAGRQIPVVRLVTRLGGRVEPVTYWITVGNVVVPSKTEQKLVKIRYGLRGEIPDGMLVRVSSIDADARKAFNLHGEFVAAMAEAMSPENLVRVAGAL